MATRVEERRAKGEAGKARGQNIAGSGGSGGVTWSNNARSAVPQQWRADLTAHSVMYSQIMNTIAPLRGSRRNVWRSKCRCTLSGKSSGGAGRGALPGMSSGPYVPSAHASSSSCEGVGVDVGERTW